MTAARRAWVAGLTLLILLSPGAALADKVDELVTALRSDESYKVRVQAALVLGKLKDKRALRPLVQALKDENPTVRAVAAQSLGVLGDASAVASLRVAAEADESEFVKREAEAALRKLKATSGATRAAAGGGAARFFLAVGPLARGSKKVDKGAVEMFRAALLRELGKTPGVTLEAGGDKGRTAYWVDGNIVRLTISGGEVSCDVKVLLASWPSKAIILWADGGATVQGSGNEEAGKKDCLEAASQSVRENIQTFLKSQG